MPLAARRQSTPERRRAFLLWVALMAFGLAQAIAFAHATQHVGRDAAGLPGDHAQLCTDCATVLPLLAVAGGVGLALALMRPVSMHALPRATGPAAGAGRRGAFRSRAPPR
jgi:Mn2+/Fe2+ NRAMP family transporter